MCLVELTIAFWPCESRHGPIRFVCDTCRLVTFPSLSFRTRLPFRCSMMVYLVGEKRDSPLARFCRSITISSPGISLHFRAPRRSSSRCFPASFSLRSLCSSCSSVKSDYPRWISGKPRLIFRPYMTSSGGTVVTLCSAALWALIAFLNSSM